MIVVASVVAGAVAFGGATFAASHATGASRVLLAVDGSQQPPTNDPGGHGPGHGNNVPEAPYALIFPAVLAAAGIVAYRRKIARS